VRNISCLPLTMLYKGDNSCVSGYRWDSVNPKIKSTFTLKNILQ
jgi:hypothetical protein